MGWGGDGGEVEWGGLVWPSFGYLTHSPEIGYTARFATVHAPYTPKIQYKVGTLSTGIGTPYIFTSCVDLCRLALRT
jgi:hypothetical protein